MANINKFRDRNPSLRPAGISKYNKNETMKTVLTYPLLETLPFQSKIHINRQNQYTPKPLTNDLYQGIYTKVKGLINPPFKSLFQNLRQELNETVFNSYWNKSVGRIRDGSLNLPQNIDKYTTCFGKRSISDSCVKDLVSPDKTPGQVLLESEIGHSLYIKTHNDYFPGEQINRNYENPPINKNLIWGEKVVSDPEGGCTKKILKWYNQSELTAVNEKQARHKFSSQPQVGTVFAPNQNINCVSENYTFGKVLKKDQFGAGDLMLNCRPSQEKIKLKEEIAHINQIRTSLRKRVPPFPFREFLQCLMCEDDGNCGWIPLIKMYKISKAFNIHVELKLESLMKRLNILSQDRMVKYKLFVDMINVNDQFPALSKLQDLPPECLTFETTYKAATDDMKRPSKALPTAGMPSWYISHGDLNSETSMRTIISPNIFVQFGLSHRDFFKPHTRDYINDLFCKIGVNLPNDIFNELCDIGEQQDNSGGICVETFRNLLDHLATKEFQNSNS